MATIAFLHAIVVAAALGLVLAAALEDFGRYRIPNAIGLALVALYPLHVLTSPVPVDWAWAPAIAFGVLAAGFAAFAAGFMGGGDAKLMAAVALWAGPALVVEFLLLTALAGGVLALVLSSQMRFGVLLAFERLGAERLRQVMLNAVIPYGVAIAAGAVFVCLQLMKGPV